MADKRGKRHNTTPAKAERLIEKLQGLLNKLKRSKKGKK